MTTEEKRLERNMTARRELLEITRIAAKIARLLEGLIEYGGSDGMAGHA